MEGRIGTCIDCVSLEANDCPLYIAEDKNGFVVACCIVYIIAHGLTILRRVDDLTDYED